MKFKIGEMKSKKIVNGIFITGLVFFILLILRFFSNVLLVYGTSGDSVIVQLTSIIYIIITIAMPLIVLILFKFSCEGLYKIIKACEIIIQNYDSKNN